MRILIYIPLCIYFNVFNLIAMIIEVFTFTFHYVSISTGTANSDNIFCQSFTFHYVSISTDGVYDSIAGSINLHSTMYLFQLNSIVLSFLGFKFTFHYVSISTKNIVQMYYQQSYLHSTMYLFQQFDC